jgi:hypothetical protein
VAHQGHQEKLMMTVLTDLLKDRRVSGNPTFSWFVILSEAKDLGEKP